MELNSTILTITVDPEEEEFTSFKSTFNLKANQELIDTLLCKYSELAQMHSEHVPKSLDENVFWCRYLFRYNEVMKEDQKRREALQNVLQNAEVEEKLTWDDDDDDDQSANQQSEKEKENAEKEITVKSVEDEEDKDKIVNNNNNNNNEDDIPLLSPTPPPTPPPSISEPINKPSDSIDTPSPKNNALDKRINELITDNNNNIISPIQPNDSEKNLIISTPIKTPEPPKSTSIETVPELPSLEANIEESTKIPPSTPPTNNSSTIQTNNDNDDDWADWD